MLLNETGRNKTFSIWWKGSKKEKKKSSGHFQMLVILMITKDKGNCSLAGITFLDKLAALPLRKEIIKMVTGKKKKSFVDLVLVASL